MRARSDSWKAIVQGSEFLFDVKLDINGTEYTRITAPKINRACMNGPLTVGDCISSMMEVSIDTDDVIPRSAEIKILGRVKSQDGLSVSEEWLPFGTYYIDRRPKDFYGMVKLSCYDAMLKADVDFANPERDVVIEEWPKSMADVVLEIAERIGVGVANIEEISTELMIDYPQRYTMRQVLGYISGVHGGNMIINRDGDLQFIKLFKEDDPGQVDVILGKFDRGLPLTVKGILTSDGTGLEYTNGDILSEGVIKIEGNPYVTQDIADALWGEFEGKIYYPYEATRCITDPAFEMGDPVVIGDSLWSSHYYIADETLDNAYIVSLSCPPAAEMESEYPYKSATKQINEELVALSRQTNTIERSLDHTTSTITQIQGDIANANNLINQESMARSELDTRLSEQLSGTAVQISELSQTADGLRASITQIQDAKYDEQIETLKSQISVNAGQITLIVEKTTTIESATTDKVESDASGAYLQVVTDGIKVDDTGSDTYMKLDGSNMSFKADADDEVVSYYGSDGMRTPEATIDGNMIVGEYKWISRPGRMSLVYIGE